MSRDKIDPWKYNTIGMDSTTTPLYKKQYKDIKSTDFYNIDHTVIPRYIDPAKLYLYRYLRYEPYFYEMFNLNREVHPYHPLLPSTEEITKMIQKEFFVTRNPHGFPLHSKKSHKKKPGASRMSPEVLEKMATLFTAGLSDSNSHLSPENLESDWSPDDLKTDSGATLASWQYGSEPRVEKPASVSSSVTDSFGGAENVRELWWKLVMRNRLKKEYPNLPHSDTALSKVELSFTEHHHQADAHRKVTLASLMERFDTQSSIELNSAETYSLTSSKKE